MIEYQVVVYGVEDDIVSSQTYDQEPNDETLEELLSEGVRLECYEVENDFCGLIFTMDNENPNE